MENSMGEKVVMPYLSSTLHIGALPFHGNQLARIAIPNRTTIGESVFDPTVRITKQ